MRTGLHSGRVVLIAFITSLSAACNQANEQSASFVADDSCESKIAIAALDEACAIELAKAALKKEGNIPPYGSYTARFDSDEKLWIVMAYNESGPPGNHMYIAITLTGTTKYVMPGY